jgi:hypothetical protein
MEEAPLKWRMSLPMKTMGVSVEARREAEPASS